MKKFKGSIKRFPPEVVERMLEEQERQGNRRDVQVFERERYSSYRSGGFDWHLSKEGAEFWVLVINRENFDLFFNRYPKEKEEVDKLCKIIYAEGKEVLFSVESIEKQGGIIIIKAK